MVIKNGRTVLRDLLVEGILIGFPLLQRLTAVTRGVAILMDQPQHWMVCYEKHGKSTRMSTVIITHGSGSRRVRGLTLKLRGADRDDTLLIGGVINLWLELDERETLS